MFRFKLKGIEIAKHSQLTPNQISTFQNGGNLRIDSVEKILEALPKKAKKYMLSLVEQDESLTLPLPQDEDEELED